MIYPPLDRNFQIPDIALGDDLGNSTTLRTLIGSSQDITLLIPGFTTCHGVCPLLTRLYKDLLSTPAIASQEGRKVSVIFFSFDPNETAKSLSMFRNHAELPDDWVLTHADDAATQTLLSALQYTVMRSPEGFQHPAQAYVFTKNLNWIGSLYGADVTVSEFKEICASATFRTEHPTLSSIRDFAANPNTIAVGAGGGFLFSIVLMSWLAIRLTRSARE